jgi:hypothetical protein
MTRFLLVLGLSAVAYAAAGSQTQQAAPTVAELKLKADLTSAVTTTAIYSQLTLSAKKAAGQWIITVSPEGVGWTPPRIDTYEHAEATIVESWYDENNNLLGNLAQQQMFKRVDPTGPAIYAMPLPNASGAIRLRFTVRDAINGNMGTLDLREF